MNSPRETKIDLYEAERRLRQLTANINSVFWVASLDLTEILYVSPAYETIWARSCEGLYEDPHQWVNAIIPEDRQAMLEAFAKLFSRGEKSIVVEYKIVRPDGSIRWISDQGFLLCDENDVPYQVMGIAEDITEKRRLLEVEFRHQHHLELVEAMRINGMAELVSTLAHELNQPLTTIAMYAQACLRNLKTNENDLPALVKALETTVQQAEHAGAIIHRMKSMVRKSELLLESLDINGLIMKLAPLLAYETNNNAVSIQYQLIEKLPLVYADKIQTGQVLLNLTRNLISMLTAAKIVDPKITIITVADGPTHVAIQLCDNGSGFLESSLKSLGIATDSNEMELAISRTIIEAQAGQLTMTNNAVGGTCLQFTLPCVKENKS